MFLCVTYSLYICKANLFASRLTHVSDKVGSFTQFLSTASGFVVIFMLFAHSSSGRRLGNGDRRLSPAHFYLKPCSNNERANGKIPPKCPEGNKL